jgi:predicted Zn-dependent protease
MKLIIALSLLLSACVIEPDVNTLWTDETRVAVLVTSGASIESAQAFSERMQRDMAMWNTALEARGCAAPFRYVTNLHDADVTIYLRHKSDWPFTGSIGAQFADAIHILSEGDGSLDSYVDDPMWNVGLHELGHGLGLGHSVYVDSVMGDGDVPMMGLPLSRRDVDDAARALGCL